MACIDAETCQVVDCIVGKHVFADPAHHHHACAQLGCRDSLVCSLAAAAHGKIICLQRLSGFRHLVDIGDKVDHIGANHSDIHYEQVLCWVYTAAQYNPVTVPSIQRDEQTVR